ncbi:MAG: ornithine cyclodeaminase family protein [Tepidanaerobacteraceae bacterium]|jgi:ornithine cyclodeaminase
MLILTREDLKKAITMEDAIDAIEIALKYFSTGKTKTPLRTVININEAKNEDIMSMPGYIEDMGAAVKLLSVFPGNYELGKATISSIVAFFDDKTGEPLALMDGGYLTAMRTGAISGVATKYLARKDSSIVAVIGAGIQARTQLWAVCCVRDIKQVKVFDVSGERVDGFIKDMKDKFTDIDFIKAESSDEAVKDSDIVLTATTSTTPVFNVESLKKGVHINAIGSYTPKMQELPEGVFKIAGKVLVESVDAVVSEAGDFIIPMEKGIFSKDNIHGELGDLVLGRITGRENTDEITLFKTVGIAVQDVACAAKIYDNARKMNLGQEIRLDA